MYLRQCSMARWAQPASPCWVLLTFWIQSNVWFKRYNNVMERGRGWAIGWIFHRQGVCTNQICCNWILFCVDPVFKVFKWGQNSPSKHPSPPPTKAILPTCPLSHLGQTAALQPPLACHLHTTSINKRIGLRSNNANPPGLACVQLVIS